MYRIMRFLIGTLGLLGAIQALAQTPVPLPVSGNLGQILGAPSPYAAVTFQLVNCPSPVTVTGNNVIVQTTMQVSANASGLVNSAVWANDQITCNGTTGASQYRVVYVVNGVPSGSPACFQVLSTQGVWNLSTQQPITCNITPPNPQDVTWRNVAATGNISAPTAAIPVVTGHSTLDVPTTTTVNGHALSSNVVVSASDLTTGTLPHAQIPALVSADIPNNAANTTGTAALAQGLTGTPAIAVASCAGCAIPNVSVTVPSIAIPAATCYGAAASTTPTTFTMAGLTTSMSVAARFTSNPAAIAGWGSAGGLELKVWPSATNVGSYIVCNPTSGSITSGSLAVTMTAQ